MQCAKVHLQDRSKPRTSLPNERPRRICQKRLVDPDHEEDPRWTALDRFHYNDVDNEDLNEQKNVERNLKNQEDLYLSVQNLQFKGNTEQQRRPRTSFKYKTVSNNQKHRMFVKQVVEDFDQLDRSSELSNYFDVYSKYFTNNDQSRPPSSKSSIVLYCLNNKCKENKATQVDLRRPEPRRKSNFGFIKKAPKSNFKPSITDDKNTKDDDKNTKDDDEDTKIAFHKNGKRKSLTISRTESPATVQVIRVDVVCNYSSSSTMSDYEENKKQSCPNEQEDKENLNTNLKKSRFANKYMLTNTVKTLDENVSGGKVTLMCKTFKLTDRSKILSDRTPKNAPKIQIKDKLHM